MLIDTQHVLAGLAKADREHQKEAAVSLLLRSVKYVCGFLLAAFALDVVLHLSAGWRLGLMSALALGIIVLLGVAWHVAVHQRNRLERIARFLEGRDPGLGSRLINLLQLREQCRDPELAPLTRELARQAVEGYSAELEGTVLERLARTGVLRTHARSAFVVLAIFAGITLLFFRVTAVELARFSDPFGDHPPYSFTRLQVVSPGPQGTNVIYGKGFVVRVTATGHRPKELFLTCFPPGHPEKAKTMPMFEKPGVGYDQLVEPVQSDLVVFAHTKDRASMSRQARICVILTPKLERAFLRIAPPAYTRIEPSEKPYAFGNAQALSGSQLTFRLQSNRPLREGLLEFNGDGAPERIAMKPVAEREVACTMIARRSGRLKFSLTDIDGLLSQDALEGALTVTHDLPPEVKITTPEHDSFVAIDFKLEAHIDATDDYGLQMLRVHIGSNGVYASPQIVTNATAPRDLRHTLDLNFEQMGFKPGDVLSLYAEAVDTAPEPHLARSQAVRIYVISVEDYNNYLREQTDIAESAAKYDDLMNHLDELIEQQKRLGEAADALQEQIAKAPVDQREKMAMQLDELLGKQNELNTRLDQHADRMEEFVRKDPVYDVERDLQEILGDLAELIRSSTMTNNASGKQIAERSSPGGKRQVSPDMAKDFKSASDEQVTRLQGVQEDTEEQVAQTLEDMSKMQELLKDFNEFELLYRVQKELAAQTQAYDRTGQLSREDQLALKELAATEKEVGDRLDELSRKLVEHADAAEELFPKAAGSGRRLSESMADLRLSPLARQATSQMLAGKGDRAFRMADRLREEMEKLFSDCQQCRGQNGDELDSYLSLTRSMNPGQNFAQMARSRKFGSGKGRGIGLGIGEGASGSSGFAMMDSPPMNVMGNEQKPNQGAATARETSRQGRGSARVAAAGSRPDPEKADVLKGLNPVNRESAAVNSEAGLDDYAELVDTYFKAITTRKQK